MGFKISIVTVKLVLKHYGNSVEPDLLANEVELGLNFLKDSYGPV